MRDLYYEVIRLDKKKGLSFRFNLIKGKEISVQGAAFVKFGAKNDSVCFDPRADSELSGEEKEYIVMYVLKYIERSKKR